MKKEFVIDIPATQISTCNDLVKELNKYSRLTDRNIKIGEVEILRWHMKNEYAAFDIVPKLQSRLLSFRLLDINANCLYMSYGNEWHQI